MRELQTLTEMANERFAAYLDMLPGPTPAHRVEFSPRITTSWALIYYRRHLVRLSPYLFLLDAQDLARGSHWSELDATLRHEAAHASLYARTGETGHPPEFHHLLRRLGVAPNGGCDLGPENAAFRFVYACARCEREWRRRHRLHGNWSCGECAPGRYDPACRMELREELGRPWLRLQERLDLVEACLREAEHTRPAPLKPIVATHAMPMVVAPVAR